MKKQVNHNQENVDGESSGLKSGVESGLSEVQGIKGLDPGQKTEGKDEKPAGTSGSAKGHKGQNLHWQ